MVTTRSDVKFVSAGWAQVLKSAEVASTIHRVAEATARNVSAAIPAGSEVIVDDYVTDRAASSVTIGDVPGPDNGKLLQVRDGVLSRAAAAAGLEVTLKR